MNQDNKVEIVRLLELLSSEEPSNIKIIKEELKAAGIDPDELVDNINTKVDILIGKKKLEIAKKRLKLFQDRIKHFNPDITSITITTAKELLLNLIGSPGELASQANFRKIEQLTDEDALEILKEDNLLEFFTKFMNEDK